MHVFVQHLDGKRVRELHWRDDAPRHGEGFVVDSAYFPRAAHSFWGRMLGRKSAPTWALPFDERGSDVLELCRRPAAGSVRIVGRARAGDRGVGTLVRDAWANEPIPWRASTAFDFLVAPEEGPPVIVSLGLSPILIAPPREESHEQVIGNMDARHRSLLPNRARSGTASVVELHTGDLVEVIGVSRPIQKSARRLERVGYRDAAPPCDVIGDEDGTRVVLRIVAD